MRSIMWEGLVVKDADEIKTRNSNSHIFLTLAMAAQDGLLNLGSAPAPSPVAFGCVEQRKMFPIHTIPTRMGIEQGLRGEPHRGPGCYSPDPVSIFLNPLDVRPRSTKGWYFGATLAQRLPKGIQGIKPGPADYQAVDLDKPSDMYKPFGSAIMRLPDDDKSKDRPGPGSYKHDVPISRQIEFDESFGGKKTLRGVVIMKCNNGIPDKCKQCSKEPVGDYYENKQYALCPDCFKELQEPTPGSWNKPLKGFSKVRDCRGIHKHEFPGKNPKIIVKTEKQQRKLRLKEAYLKQYYS